MTYLIYSIQFLLFYDHDAYHCNHNFFQVFFVDLLFIFYFYFFCIYFTISRIHMTFACPFFYLFSPYKYMIHAYIIFVYVAYVWKFSILFFAASLILLFVVWSRYCCFSLGCMLPFSFSFICSDKHSWFILFFIFG